MDKKKEISNKLFDLFSMEYINSKSISDHWKELINKEKLPNDNRLYNASFAYNYDNTGFIGDRNSFLTYYAMKDMFYDIFSITYTTEKEINKFNEFIKKYKVNSNNSELIKSNNDFYTMYDISKRFSQFYIITRTEAILKKGNFDEDELKKVINKFKKDMNLGNEWNKEVNKKLEDNANIIEGKSNYFSKKYKDLYYEVICVFEAIHLCETLSTNEIIKICNNKA